MIAQRQFIVTHTPRKNAETLARKHGWGGGDSIFDYIEPYACEVESKAFVDIQAAFKHAKRLVAADLVGEVRIIEQEKRGLLWDDLSKWMVYADTKTIDKDRPNYIYDND